jgi:hypothetical protein
MTPSPTVSSLDDRKPAPVPSPTSHPEQVTLRSIETTLKMKTVPSSNVTTTQTFTSPRFQQLPQLEVAASARDALSLIQVSVDEATIPLAISHVLRTLRIYDVRDIIHTGQLSYTSLKDILGTMNYDAASNLIVDLHVLANYLMQSELFDLLAKHGTTEDAWAEFTQDIAGITRHSDRTHMEQYGKEYATFLRVSSGQRESESVRSRSSRSSASHTHRSRRDDHEDNRSASSTLDSRRSRTS